MGNLMFQESREKRLNLQESWALLCKFRGGGITCGFGLATPHSSIPTANFLQIISIRTLFAQNFEILEFLW
jgi:hypothetical protein